MCNLSIIKVVRTFVHQSFKLNDITNECFGLTRDEIEDMDKRVALSESAPCGPD